jgi:hypothetical protein
VRPWAVWDDSVALVVRSAFTCRCSNMGLMEPVRPANFLEVLSIAQSALPLSWLGQFRHRTIHLGNCFQGVGVVMSRRSRVISDLVDGWPVRPRTRFAWRNGRGEVFGNPRARWFTLAQCLVSCQSNGEVRALLVGSRLHDRRLNRSRLVFLSASHFDPDWVDECDVGFEGWLPDLVSEDSQD